MHYFNQSYIQLMKINKNQFITKPSECPDGIEAIIEKVISVFKPQITSKKLKVYICCCGLFSSMRLVTDWTKYELIIFNIL